MDVSRRKFLKKSSLISIAGVGMHLFSGNILNAMNSTGNNMTNEPFKLPDLPYEYDQLEPHIDKMTMEIHHKKHHQAYIDNLNKAMIENNNHSSLDDLIKGVSKYSPAIRNNAGGHWNHSFFWKIMKPRGGGSPTGKIASAINETFETFDSFKTKLEEAASKRFGSGWAWLIVNADRRLSIGSTPNQDNPLMDVSELKGIPLLGIDVWEHAYYLKYQNKRADYVKAWWNVVNWDEVNNNLAMAEKK
jgi:Fe-Mn family superoxide dismutase